MTVQAALKLTDAPERRQEIRATKYILCANCGVQIPDRADRCGWCGQKRASK